MCQRLSYTLSQKVPNFKLSVTLSDLNCFSKFLQRWKAYKLCYKTHTTILASPWACCYTALGN